MSKIIKKEFVHLKPPKVFEMSVKNEENEKEVEANAKRLEEEAQQLKEKYDKKLKEIQNKEKSILEKANREAELIKEEILSQAKEEGFNAGYDEGLKKSKKEIEELKEKFDNFINKLDKEQRKVLENNKNMIVKLVKVLVKKIISKELSDRSEEIVLKVIDEISKEISDKSKIKIQLSTEDYKKLFDKHDYIKSMFVGTDEIILKPDNNLKPGDVFIDTEMGSYDLLIENKMEEVFKLLDEGSEST